MPLISNTYLIVDARERSVIPFIETEVQDYAFIVKQVNTADYLICKYTNDEPIILAAIERKTHEDFAASFKDGRHENIKKMCALRKVTGCQLYYFIEGPAFPNINRRFAHIPFNNILAAITRLMVREGVFIVQTENESHSAKRLADFLKVYDTEEQHFVQTEDQDKSDEIFGGMIAVPDILTSRIAQSEDEISVCMWSQLKGISIVLGKMLTRAFTIADLATQKITPEQIRTLKSATNRIINKDAVASLLAVREGSIEHAVKLLSGIRSITVETATIILNESGSLSNICTQSVATLAIVKIPQKNRVIQLGKIRAERIWNMLHYKDVPEQSPELEIIGTE